MTGDRLVRDFAALRRRIADLDRQLDEARRRRDDLVREASAAGLSAREIGRLAGLSHVTVLTILGTPATA